MADLGIHRFRKLSNNMKNVTQMFLIEVISVVLALGNLDFFP